MEVPPLPIPRMIRLAANIAVFWAEACRIAAMIVTRAETAIAFFLPYWSDHHPVSGLEMHCPM